MSRAVWCRRCKAKLEHLGGALPESCPECAQDAYWSAIEVPLKDFVLTGADRNFMRSNKIAVDPEDDPNVDDGA